MKYRYIKDSENLNQTAIMLGSLFDSAVSEEKLETLIINSVNIFNAPAENYNEEERKKAYHVVRFALHSGLVGFADELGNPSKTVLRTCRK